MHYVQQNLRFFRKYNRYLQTEVASMLDVTVGQVKTYETGIAVPPLDVLIRMADMMSISLDTLVLTELTTENYLKEKEKPRPDVVSRLEALEKAVNKIVNKTPQRSRLKSRI